jgi:hypothetical protein
VISLNPFPFAYTRNVSFGRIEILRLGVNSSSFADHLGLLLIVLIAAFLLKLKTNLHLGPFILALGLHLMVGCILQCGEGFGFISSLVLLGYYLHLFNTLFKVNQNNQQAIMLARNAPLIDQFKPCNSIFLHFHFVSSMHKLMFALTALLVHNTFSQLAICLSIHLMYAVYLLS